jgi:predicted HTH transcriptional regulator
VHLFDDRIELFLNDGTYVHGMKRVHCEHHNKRSRSINHRHVIHSLVRKPGALPGLVYLDQLHSS